MAANPPTKLPDPAPAKPADEKAPPAPATFDRFHPEMPQIPGVSGGRASRGGFAGLDTQRLLQIAGVAGAIVLLGGIVLWRATSKPRGAIEPATDDASQSAPAPEPALVVQPPETLNVAANVDELSKPWSSNKFTFVNPLTQESIHALVVRLPNNGLWAFSLQAPYGRCELEFVADLGALASKYKFNASHPMVVNPCDGSVYDPLKVGPLDGNTWARGGIVKGNSLRPPISIDVRVQGRSIIADSIE